MQCSHFNTMPYKGTFYRWEAVINRGEQGALIQAAFVQLKKDPPLVSLFITQCESALWGLPLSVSPCELHCRPLNEHFSEKMRDAVTDGTACYQGNKSRDMCINGICKVSELFLLFLPFINNRYVLSSPLQFLLPLSKLDRLFHPRVSVSLHCCFVSHAVRFALPHFVFSAGESCTVDILHEN